MRIRNIGEGEALGAAALRGIGHIDRQEAVEVIGHACCHRRGRGARGYLEKAAPVEMVQAAEQRLALFQMPRLDALDVGYFRVVVHDSAPYNCHYFRPAGPITRCSKGSISRCASALSRNGRFLAASSCCSRNAASFCAVNRLSVRANRKATTSLISFSLTSKGSLPPPRKAFAPP